MAGLYRLRWPALVDESTGQPLASRFEVGFPRSAGRFNDRGGRTALPRDESRSIILCSHQLARLWHQSVEFQKLQLRALSKET